MSVMYSSISIGLSISKLVVDLVKNRSSGDINRSNQIIIDYVRLVRSDIESLMHIYFRSALENLNYALTASDGNKKDYLLQARNRFIDALTVEINENLLLSHLGLALCQHLLGDEINCIKTLERVKNINYLPNNDENLIRHNMLINPINFANLIRAYRYSLNSNIKVEKDSRLSSLYQFIEEYEGEIMGDFTCLIKSITKLPKLWDKFIARNFNELKENITNQLIHTSFNDTIQ